MKGKIGAYSSPGTGHLESSGCGLLREFGQGPFLLIFIKKSLFLPEKSKKKFTFLKILLSLPPPICTFSEKAVPLHSQTVSRPFGGVARSGGGI